MPEWNYEKKPVGVPVYAVWKTRGIKGWKILPEMWHKHAVISIWERCIVMYNPRLDQRTTQLFTPSLISLDTRQVSHLPLFVSFCVVYSLSFYLLELFICRVGKGIWIDALMTTVELTVPQPPSACLHWQPFSKPKSGILSLLSTFILPSLNIYKSSEERIKACMQGDEWFNLVSNGIKWANRNSWQKLYDGEVITCRLLPYCRRWEWSAALVYRSNCMTQCREWETDMGGKIPVEFNTWVLLCMISQS